MAHASDAMKAEIRPLDWSWLSIELRRSSINRISEAEGEGILSESGEVVVGCKRLIADKGHCGSRVPAVTL